MKLRNAAHINVWELHVDDTEEVWRLRQVSQEYVGSRDEEKYFRMINDQGKHFFDGPADYISFSGADPEDCDNYPGLKEIIRAWHNRSMQRGT